MHTRSRDRKKDNKAKKALKRRQAVRRAIEERLILKELGL